METSEETITTDVLVIGAGLAGCFAAIKAKESGADVLVAEQAFSGLSGGMSPIGMQALRVVLPDDDHDKALLDTVLQSGYMVDQDYAVAAISEAWDRFQDLLKYGVNFRWDDKGDILWYFKDTINPDLKQRFAMFEPQGLSGRHMLKVKKAALRQGAKFIDRVLVTDLLQSNGRVVGAVGFDFREGGFYVFQAKAVIIATTSFNGGASGDPHLTGDGLDMALRAGAELRGMEFGKTSIAAWVPGRFPGGFIYGSLENWEQVITNARGEEFMEKYELGRRLPGRKYLGPPWPIHHWAMLRECREGRGPCYVDYRVPDWNRKMRNYCGGAYDAPIKSLKQCGLTPQDIKCELGIGRGMFQGGGIRINVEAETTIPGLYATGLASDLGLCYMYTIPSSLQGCMYTGHRAGRNGAKYAQDQPPVTIDAKQVDKLKGETYAPLGQETGVTADDVQMKILETWVYLDVRNEERLKKAVEEFKKIKDDASKLGAKDYHELRKCSKVKKLLDCSEMVAAAALIRCESRLDHFRDDYPLTDNKSWYKWTITRRIGDEIRTSLIDIPNENWKYKPEPVIYNKLEPVKES